MKENGNITLKIKINLERREEYVIPKTNLKKEEKITNGKEIRDKLIQFLGLK